LSAILLPALPAILAISHRNEALAQSMAAVLIAGAVGDNGTAQDRMPVPGAVGWSRRARPLLADDGPAAQDRCGAAVDTPAVRISVAQAAARTQ
jgi:hypothetical protein